MGCTIFKFYYSNILTVKAKENLIDVKNELSLFRKKALELEQKYADSCKTRLLKIEIINDQNLKRLYPCFIKHLSNFNRRLLNTYNFSITSYSCNNELDLIDEYLKLTKNNSKNYCYAINGITVDNNNTFLSLEFDGNPKPLLFKKQ